MSDKSNYIVKLTREKDLLLDEAESLEKQFEHENSDLKKQIAELNGKLVKQSSSGTLSKWDFSSTQTRRVNFVDNSYQNIVCVKDVGTSMTYSLMDVTSDADLLLLKEKVQRSRDELLELKLLKSEMLTTIETLSHDNKCLSSELESLKYLFSNSLAPQFNLESTPAVNNYDNDTDELAISLSLFEELSLACGTSQWLTTHHS